MSYTQFPLNGWSARWKKFATGSCAQSTPSKRHISPYAVSGGHAVAAWVSKVDEAAVRNTQDVDLMVRRTDLPAVSAALESAGFVRRHAAGIEMFLDGPNAKARDAVRLLFAGEMVRAD